MHIRSPRRRIGNGTGAIVLLAAVGLVAGTLNLIISPTSANAATAVWGIPTQVLGIGGTAHFTSVSCVDASDCTAVGGGGPSGGEPIYATESGGVWGPTTQIPLPGIYVEIGAPLPTYEPGYFNSVSCTTADDCTGVGEVGNQPFFAIERSGVWGQIEVLDTPTEAEAAQGAYSWFRSISCTTATDCTVVGQRGDIGGSDAYYITEKSGIWGAITPLNGNSQLLGVSCSDLTDCTAVGDFGEGVGTPTETTETGGVWSVGTEIVGPTGRAILDGVSCTEASDCVAVGSDYNNLPVYAVKTDRTWSTFTEVPGIVGDPGSLHGVSCSDTGDCTAIGEDGNDQPFYITETAGNWGPPTEILGATGGTGSFAGVSCSDASDCTAVGADADSEPFYVTSQSGLSDQAPLTLTSTAGVSGQALTLTTSGGSGTGAVSFAVTDGTASGCTIFIAALTSTSAGTCIVTATKAADANYNAISSAPTTVTFTAASPAPPSPPTPPPVVTTPTTTGHGYWLVGSDGGIFTFGAAQFYGSTGDIGLQRPVVGIAPTADDGGYWLVASDGGVFSFGDTQFYGSIPGLGISPAGSGQPRSLNAPIVGIVPTVDDHGYFMVGADGGVFGFGDARFEGSCPGIGGCSGVAVAVMPDASGNGYWLVTNTGHVYAFGDAVNYGAPTSQSTPVTSAVRTTDGKGYWILYGNGAVAGFGDAPNFTGPIGAVGGLDPATAITTTSDGQGVWIFSANGSVFAYGDAPNDGSMAGQHLNGAIIAATGW